MNIKHPQFILAIDTDYLTSLGAVDGLNKIDFEKFIENADAHIVIRRRHELENNERYLQILPYAMVARTPEDVVNGQSVKWMTYYRPTSGGETRLHGNASIGFGGHIDLEDIMATDKNVIGLRETIIQSMARELVEELGVDPSVFKETPLFFHSFITDKSNAVGRVHLGVVFAAYLPSTAEINLEKSEIDFAGEFTVEELHAKQESGEIVMENWTKLIVDSLLQDNRSEESCAETLDVQ